MSEANTLSRKEKDPGLAALASFFITGLGQIYAGNTNRGIILLVISIFFGLITAATMGVFLLISIPYWIWGMFDANAQAHKFNEKLEQDVLDQKQKEREAEEEIINTVATSEFIENLDKISKLHKVKVLSDEEFAERKRSLILTLSYKKPRESAEDFLAALVFSIEQDRLSDSEVSQIKELVIGSR